VDVSAYFGSAEAAQVCGGLRLSLTDGCWYWASTEAAALTPKAIIWYVMAITKIHFANSGNFGMTAAYLCRHNDAQGQDFARLAEELPVYQWSFD
jgi:hypothetical protein